MLQQLMFPHRGDHKGGERCLAQSVVPLRHGPHRDWDYPEIPHLGFVTVQGGAKASLDAGCVENPSFSHPRSCSGGS